MLFLTEGALKSENVFGEIKHMLGLPNSLERICIFALHSVSELKAIAHSSSISWTCETVDFPNGVLDKLFESHCFHTTNWDGLRTLINTKTKTLFPTEPDIEVTSYGKIRFPLLVITGGDGKLEMKKGDIRLRSSGPGKPPVSVYDDSQFLPDEDFKTWINTTPDNPLNHKKSIAKNFFNGEQIRLNDYRIIGDSGDSILELTLDWTNYCATFLTNLSTQMSLPFRNDGKKVCQIYQAPLGAINQCRLSNPIAVNLSVISSDNYIFIASRNKNSAWNITDEIQPAVSTTANKNDLDQNGNYDPFYHAIRSVEEEVTGNLVAENIDVTLFGLARTCKTRFPFLFGDAQVRLSRTVLEANDLKSGKPIGIPFTVAGVFDWLKSCYNDQKLAEKSIIIGTTVFSVMESCRHRFCQEDWCHLLEMLAEL